jgi:hypothetical protein
MTTEQTPYDILISSLISRADADDFTERIDESLDRLFQAKITFEDSLSEIFPRSQKEKLMAVIEAEKIELTELATVEAFLRDLKERIGKIPVLELTLAIDPSEKLLQRVQEWVEDNTEDQQKTDRRINDKY